MAGFLPPILLSFPHFLHGTGKLATNSVEGFDPDPEKHGSYVVFEPTTGVPITLAKRIQVNILSGPTDQIGDQRFFQYDPKFSKIREDLLLPIVYIDIYNHDESVAKKLRETVGLAQIILDDWVIFILFWPSVALLVLIFMYERPRINDMVNVSQKRIIDENAKTSDKSEEINPALHAPKYPSYRRDFYNTIPENEPTDSSFNKPSSSVINRRIRNNSYSRTGSSYKAHFYNRNSMARNPSESSTVAAAAATTNYNLNLNKNHQNKIGSLNNNTQNFITSKNSGKYSTTEMNKNKSSIRRPTSLNFSYLNSAGRMVKTSPVNRNSPSGLSAMSAALQTPIGELEGSKFGQIFLIF